MRIVLDGCGCTPTAYAPHSLLVHGPNCPRGWETPLSAEELEEWERQARAVRTLTPRAKEFTRLPDYPPPKDIWHTCGPTCGCNDALEGIPLARRK